MYLPEEIQRQHDLQGSRPQHVEEGGEVHEPLCIHRHQIHNFSHRGWTLGGVSYHQCLKEKDSEMENFIQAHFKILQFKLRGAESSEDGVSCIPSCRWLLWEPCGHSCRWQNSTESDGGGWGSAARLWRTWGRPTRSPTNQEHLSV